MRSHTGGIAHCARRDVRLKVGAHASAAFSLRYTRAICRVPVLYCFGGSHTRSSDASVSSQVDRLVFRPLQLLVGFSSCINGLTYAPLSLCGFLNLNGRICDWVSFFFANF